MVAALVHRGPDDQGDCFVPMGGAMLGLGFRRLSILDLSQAGHQPMVHPETGDILIFNGEIYNFREMRAELEAGGSRFRGHSDTEVLLHALTKWGPAALNRLAGMYALGFYHAQGQQLLLARDPLGIKPLYVAQTKNEFLFSSEVRSLLSSGLVSRTLEPRGLAAYLAFGAAPSPLTIIKDVEAFPAGSYQWLSSSVLEKRPPPPKEYWDIPKPREIAPTEDVCQIVRDKLNISVREHLESDVPVGVFLSGGLDSTITASLAAKHTDQLRTFTVGFADNQDLSESNVAAETARQIRSKHFEIQILGEQAESACIEWLGAIDRPSIDGLNTFIISQAVRREGIVVALSGLGGDELFGGYNTFFRIPRLMGALRTIRWLPPSLRSVLSTIGTVGRPQVVVEKAAAMARSSGSLLDLYLFSRRVMSNRQLADLGMNSRTLRLRDDYLPAASIDTPSIDSCRPRMDHIDVGVASLYEQHFAAGCGHKWHVARARNTGALSRSPRN